MIYVKLTVKSVTYKAWIVFNKQFYGLTNKGKIIQTYFMEDKGDKVAWVEEKRWDFQLVGDSLEEVRKQLPELWL